MNQESYIYQIDANDRIVQISDNWQAFADENSPAQQTDAANVQGSLVWDFIQDIETHYLYQEIFRHIRQGKSFAPIPFRCDSPEERRFMELRFRALPNDQIEVESRILRTEPRPPVKMLMEDTPRSEKFISLCSMCKKIKVAENTWVEIEEGVGRLKLFESDKMPQLTHGLCPDCYRRTMDELDLLFPQK